MEFYRDAAAGNSLVSVDAGKRLLESKSKYKELNGVAATEYLEKAETMFREMGAIIGWEGRRRCWQGCERIVATRSLPVCVMLTTILFWTTFTKV